jgi:diguanylate cyclase (GGDEF)-like protein/PAS domain S-box-containing protein
MGKAEPPSHDPANTGNSLNIIKEQGRLIYMQAPVSNISVLTISLLFYFILSPRTDSPLVGYWVFFLYLTACYRLFLWYWRRKKPEARTPFRWFHHYIFASALVGLSWSLIYPLVYLSNDPIVAMALSMLAFGVMSSAVPILAVSMRAFVVYTYPQAFMLGYAFSLFQAPAYNWLVVALAVYLVMTTLFTFNSNRKLIKTIRLQLENEYLINQLADVVDQREKLIENRTQELKKKNQDLLTEIRERRQAELFKAGQRHILEHISKGDAPLNQLLEQIVLLAETQAKGMRGSILLLKDNCLRLGAAPNLPADYNKLIDGIEIGPEVGSCGTAAFSNKRVVVSNVHTDPLWAGYSQLGSAYGFAACWSEPVLDSAGKVVGTFALYHHDPVAPDPEEIRLIETMSQIASIAIERSITEQRLRQSATVFQSSLEGVMITDADNYILDVNQAFEQITGYTRNEVIGHRPDMLRSGRHDREFYQQMWRSLEEAGQWRGEIWNRRKNGVVYPEWLNISCIRDNTGNPMNYVAVFSDITSIKRSEEELDHMAHHDPLTDLPNRLLFNSRLEQAIKHAKRNNSGFAVLFIDLDRFKNINDSLGHKAGDELLQQLALRIRDKVRLDDTVARISGDEFVVLLEDVMNAESTAVAIEKISSVFADSFLLEGHEIRITASIGIALYPTDGENVSTLLRNADAAMYRAKDEGRNTYQFYTKEMTSNAFERVVIENALRMALERNEFHLVYQPQMQMDTLEMIGLEALIRWTHPELGEVSPSMFIPLAEDNGLIHDIGSWVLETACIQGRQWLDQGYRFGRISVNVARPQLQHSNFVERVKKTLEKTHFPADRLELEVTESYIMQNTEHAIEQLEALRILGLSLAIDDFGTGYSSMSYLKLLPIQKLKIDQSFVRDIPYDSNDMAISEAVIALGKALGLNVIAEGVETNEQARFLLEKGCHEGQGYLYCKPQPPETIASSYFIGQPMKSNAGITCSDSE